MKVLDKRSFVTELVKDTLKGAVKGILIGTVMGVCHSIGRGSWPGFREIQQEQLGFKGKGSRYSRTLTFCCAKFSTPLMKYRLRLEEVIMTYKQLEQSREIRQWIWLAINLIPLGWIGYQLVKPKIAEARDKAARKGREIKDKMRFARR